MKNKKIYILFSILIAFFCFSIVCKTFPNDTYSAIKIGDYILHNGIDFIEHFNFNELTYHNARWLFNIIIALIYNKFDFFGVYIFTVVNSVSLGLVMFNFLYKKNKNLLFSFIITLFSIEFITNNIVARAQTISYILLFLEVIFLEEVIKGNKKYIIGLLLTSILIANIHTTIWPMTIILFLPYFMEYIISKIFKNKILYSETKDIKTLIISFLIIIASGLITPVGLLPYTFMFKTLSGLSSTFIIELQRANLIQNYYLVILFIIYIVLFIFIRKKIKISDIFMVLGLFIMSYMAIRNIPFLIVIGSICLSRLIYDNIKTDNIVDIILTSKILLCLISFLVIVLSSVFIIKNIYNKEYVDKSEYPVYASDYIIKNIDLDSLRLYNDFDNGAYLEFRGIKVFLDSRSEVYCKEFNNTSILEDWYNVYNLKTDYKTIFNKYNFNYVLLYKNKPLNNLVSIDKDYEEIYNDEYFVLYKKVE